jgi:hypothetical protein
MAEEAEEDQAERVERGHERAGQQQPEQRSVP